MIKLIINADDFGMDENRTSAILESFQMGVVTATTAMVNMPWFDRAVELANGTRLYDNIGLHLTLTEGRPLTEMIKGCPRFCHADGTFNAEFHRHAVSRLFLSRKERKAIAEEAEAQMRKFCQSGLPLRHLDSHHHSHTDWAVARIVLPIARRYGFTSVRRSRDLNQSAGLGKKLYKRLINAYMARTIGFRTDGFGAVEDLRRLEGKLPSLAVFEIMVHPLYRHGEELSLGGTLFDGLRGEQTMSGVAALLQTKSKVYSLSNYQEI